MSPRPPPVLNAELLLLAVRRDSLDITGVIKNADMALLYPYHTFTNWASSYCARNMPQLTKKATDNIQVKKANTCAPPSLATCLLLRDPLSDTSNGGELCHGYPCAYEAKA